MRGPHADRIWIGIGAAGAVVLLAIGYFLLISPKYEEAEALHEQADLAAIQAISLERRLAELEQQQDKLPQYQAQLRRDKAALPTDSGVPDFLRQLQDAGERVGAEVTNLSVGVPAPATGGGGTVHALPVTVTADGTARELSPFIEQLQQVQSRAVLVESVNLAAAAANNDGNGEMNLTLNLKVFVDSGQPAPTPAATN